VRTRTPIGRPLVVAAAILAVVSGFWYFKSGPPRAAKPTAGGQIIAFGDSLVEGAGATPGHDFVSVLSERLDVPIVNAGRGGDTTASALSRLESDVLTRNPRVVIVLLGGNDFLRRVPQEETFRNLDTIVTRIRSQGAAVLLLAINPGLFSSSYGDAYEEVARRTLAGLVPDVLDGITGHGDRTSDAIHPNDAGYALIADRVEPALRDLVR
jgi:acyl-CoA thioesterase-1